MVPNLVVGEKSDALHLMEDRIVTGVYLVPPVDVPGQQEGVQTGPDQFGLVGRGVGAEHGRPGDGQEEDKGRQGNGQRESRDAQRQNIHLFR